ncbi:DUF6538 domain-containing protein [Methylobacterium sp. WSM2598]|nr:DUF6538 domain-containing protein [Methylobacterium sp. WSM2598]
MRRSGSSYHQLVQRIPADVAAKVRGMKLTIPIGEGEVHLVISDKAKDVRTSLRTRDPVEAKVRQAVAVAYLEKVWRSVREGPQRLTQRQGGGRVPRRGVASAWSPRSPTGAGTIRLPGWAG